MGTELSTRKRRKPIKRKVALLTTIRDHYIFRFFIHGVTAYIRKHEQRPISICVKHPRLHEHSLRDWQAQGIIICLRNRAICRQVSRLKIPVVCIGDAEYLPSWPRIKTDHAAVARLGAEHLLELGFKQFGYCGYPLTLWSLPRQEHFKRLIRARGYPCSVYNLEMSAGAEDAKMKSLERWIVGLPKPAGIMASDDICGQTIIDACRRLGILMPDEIAVVGVEADTMFLGEISDPSLSCVILDEYRDGYEAMAMLDTLMSGEKLVEKVRLVGPIGINTRQSTDVMAITDRNIASAVRYIHENACKGISVGDVLKAVPQSRRILEYRFRKLIGHTPHEEILRVRLNRAKMLLSESNMSQEQIAEQAGFNNVGYFSSVFHQDAGMTPGNYRRMKRSRQ